MNKIYANFVYDGDTYKYRTLPRDPHVIIMSWYGQVVDPDLADYKSRFTPFRKYYINLQKRYKALSHHAFKKKILLGTYTRRCGPPYTSTHVYMILDKFLQRTSSTVISNVALEVG